MKSLMSEQSKRNRKEFENVPIEQRITYEGVQPGTYVRIEIKVYTINIDICITSL